jgi:hypothetical protein
MFRSYAANKEVSYNHILEAVSLNKKYLPILIGRFGYKKEELASGCWLRAWDHESKFFKRLDCMLHRDLYSNCEVSNHLQDRVTRKTTSVLVDWFLKYILQMKRNRVRLEKDQRAIEAVSEMENPNFKYTDETFAMLFSQLNITVPERYLLMWTLEMIEEDEVMSLLGVSRATLYNRWSKLKIRLLEAYYKPSEGSTLSSENILPE